MVLVREYGLAMARQAAKGQAWKLKQVRRQVSSHSYCASRNRSRAKRPRLKTSLHRFFAQLMGYRAENRTRAYLTASRRSTNCCEAPPAFYDPLTPAILTFIGIMHDHGGDVGVTGLIMT